MILSFLACDTFTLCDIMEETNQSSSDHRGLKLQNIIQKLSEHCDIKNPEELETFIDKEETDSLQGVPEIKRRKQDTSDTSVNGSRDDAHSLHSSTDKNTEGRHSDLKLGNNITKSQQQEDKTRKASSTLLPERISARIRSLKSKKVAYKEDWVDPDQIRLSGQRLHVQSNKQSNKNNSHEEITKTKTAIKKRKRKKKESFQSVEDYVNEAPLIHVGNLVGLRKCCLCAVMFVEKEQLLNHMKAVHHLDDKMSITKEAATETESLQCDDKKDAQSIPDEKPFKCSQCESSFRKSSGLKQHVTRQHSQNTLQKSTQAQSNQSSKKSCSANDRPYACQVCGKAFKRKHHLQEHSYIHSDDKPYKCDTCSKTFNQRICLTKHLPCKEHEKPHRKPSCTKTLETGTGDVTHEQPRNQENDQLFDFKETEVSLTGSGSVCGLADNIDSNSESNSCLGTCNAPEVKLHVNGSEHNGKSHLSNGEPSRDNLSSKDTENHATNVVNCEGSVTENSVLNVSGLSSSTRAVTTVANDQTSSVKKQTANNKEKT